MAARDNTREGKKALLYDGHNRKAHHIALELDGRTVPYGLSGLHRCDTPLCVRFDHLFIGTRADNQADMKAKGRWANQFVKGPAYA